MVLLNSDGSNAHILMSVGQTKVLALALAQLELSQLRDVAVIMQSQGYEVNEGTVAALIAEFHFHTKKVLNTNEEEEEDSKGNISDLPNLKEDKPN